MVNSVYQTTEILRIQRDGTGLLSCLHDVSRCLAHGTISAARQLTYRSRVRGRVPSAGGPSPGAGSNGGSSRADTTREPAALTNTYRASSLTRPAHRPRTP